MMRNFKRLLLVLSCLLAAWVSATCGGTVLSTSSNGGGDASSGSQDGSAEGARLGDASQADQANDQAANDGGACNYEGGGPECSCYCAWLAPNGSCFMFQDAWSCPPDASPSCSQANGEAVGMAGNEAACARWLTECNGCSETC
jgi:hypothetical protein